MGIIKCAFSIWTGTLKLFWNICHHHEMSGSKRNGNGCLFCEKHQSLSTWTPFLFSLPIRMSWWTKHSIENSESLCNNALLEHPPYFQKKTKETLSPWWWWGWHTITGLGNDQARVSVCHTHEGVCSCYWLVYQTHCYILWISLLSLKQTNEKKKKTHNSMMARGYGNDKTENDKYITHLILFLMQMFADITIILWQYCLHEIIITYCILFNFHF